MTLDLAFFLRLRPPLAFTLFPYTTLFRSARQQHGDTLGKHQRGNKVSRLLDATRIHSRIIRDRKSTRLNSSHVAISYAVFCLKKKTKGTVTRLPQRRKGRRACGPWDLTMR